MLLKSQQNKIKNRKRKRKAKHGAQTIGLKIRRIWLNVTPQ
jgi:hypothetical protein